MGNAATIVGVCGFGRCGSTMLMAMLDAGGITAVDGSAERSYEVPELTEYFADHSVQSMHRRAIKILDAATFLPLPTADWRFIWIDRDHTEQAKSTAKFLRGIVGITLTKAQQQTLIASYKADRSEVLATLRSLGTVLVVNYDRTLAAPVSTAAKVAMYLYSDFSLAPAAMAAVVHHRSPKCRRDLAFELGE